MFEAIERAAAWRLRVLGERAARVACHLVGGALRDRGETLKLCGILGYFPNLLWPRSFTEKIARRRLRRPPALWTQYADKIAVRDHVARLAGADLLPRLLLVTEDPDTIRQDALPSRFVVKANHGSGWTRVVDPEHAVSDEALRAQCREWLSMRFGGESHETWYAGIPPRILVEEYLEDRVHRVPLDFKLWVFHRRVEFVQIDFDRFTRHTRTFYDRRWQRQPWWVLYPPGPDLPRPRLLERMIEVAERLAVDPGFVRVDLYSPNDERVLFGELTFAPDAGWGRFWPSKRYDFEVGALW